MTDALDPSGEDRLVDREQQAGDGRDRALRPEQFSDFVGQKAAIANLKVFVEAARRREEALDHVLLSGPPGLGKTTLAQIVAREMGVGFRATSGPVIAKAGDLGGYHARAFRFGKIPDPAQEPAGDARRAAGPAGNLVGAIG